MEIKRGEYSSADLIDRTPKLRAIRNNLATWPPLRDFDRGDGAELINLAAICLGLWEARGCREDDLAVDLADRFLNTAITLGLDNQMRLAGVGSVGSGLVEYEWESAICARSALAALENHERALKHVTEEYFQCPSDKWAALAVALVVDAAEGLRDWRHGKIRHPVSYVRKRTHLIAIDTEMGGRIRSTDALSREQDREVLSLDSLSPTGDAYASLLPTGSRWDAEVNVQADLESVCLRSRLPKDAQLFALARYLGLPREHVAEFVSIEPKNVDAARKKFDRNLSHIQKGLRAYQRKRKEDRH